MHKHSKTGIIWGFAAIPILILLYIGLGQPGICEEVASYIFVLPALYISYIFRADLSFYGGFGLYDIITLIASFLVYYFIVGFVLGYLFSLLKTRRPKSNDLPEQEAIS